MPSPTVSFSEATRTWLRVGLLSFGGPAGQIAVMHRILVDEKRWIGEERFLHALSYCMLLPGPEAQQLATYVGGLLHGIRGGLVAGILFVLPGFLAIMGLSIAYVMWQQHPLIEGLFLGLKAAVIVLVIEALWRIGKRALTSSAALWMAALAFIAIAVLRMPFPLVVLAAGLWGYVRARLGWGSFAAPRAKPASGAATPPPIIDAGLLTQAPPSGARSLKLLALWLPLWFAPVLVCAWLLGIHSTHTQLGVFFSKMAVVTFGGAYAVLTYVAQQAVERFAWVTPAQMLDGLGLAESTPGPLILVVQFVGFLAAYQAAGADQPLLAGVLGAVLTVWVTFVPCFLWRAVYRGIAKQRRAQQRARGHHRGRSRGHRQSCAVVRLARAVRACRRARHTGTGVDSTRAGGTHQRRAGADVRPEMESRPGPHGERRPWRGFHHAPMTSPRWRRSIGASTISFSG